MDGGCDHGGEDEDDYDHDSNVCADGADADDRAVGKEGSTGDDDERDEESSSMIMMVLLLVGDKLAGSCKINVVVRGLSPCSS